MKLAERCPWLTSASRTERFLVAVSGGADSLALLHLLVAEGFQDLVVCHLDHGLRGAESLGDAEFVQQLATRLGLICELGRADVLAEMAKSSESLETAARRARHEFFAECAGKFSCKRVLLAHHADDQAETVLWNLLRGSYGLKGMREVQRGVMDLELIRPLLTVRRAELVAYLTSHGHAWREDASNAQPIAIRNRLRHEALPLLAEISGRDVTLALNRGAELTQERTELEAWALEQAKVRDPQGRLHLPVLRTLPVVLQRVALREFLREHGILAVDRDLLERGLALMDLKGPVVVNLPGGGRLRRSEQRLWLEC
jgi:tRNA(Ile)-lysidine synthase